MNKYKRSHFMVGVLAAVLLAGAFVWNTAEAITISPAKIEIEGDPGTTVSGEFLLLNEQADSKTFFTSAENFEAQGESGTPHFTREDKDLASWIKVAPTVELAAGEQKYVSFLVEIPGDAEPGGHFAAIFFGTSPVETKMGEVSVGAKTGMLVLLRVKGDVAEKGGVIEFGTIGKKRIYSSLPAEFFYRFRNDGADRVKLQGDIDIKNIFGWRKAKISANPGQGNVLPASTRRFEIKWGDEYEGKRTFFRSAWYELTHFAFGGYKANLNLKYGANDSTANSSFTIFIIPWQLLILALLVLLIFGWLITSGVKRYNAWIIRRARLGAE